MRFSVWWMVAGLALLLVGNAIFHYVWLLVLVPFVVWFLVGVSHIIVKLIQARHVERRRASFRAAGATVLLGLLVLVAAAPLTALGARIASDAQWAINHGAYERFIAKVPATSDRGISETVGPYIVDEGPPVRAAFLLTGTFTLGWCGFVYDPSGEVSQAPHGASSVARMFGEPAGCRELDQPFYHCCYQ